MMYHLRAECKNGSHFDCDVGGNSIADAKSRFERDNTGLAPFAWHGAVVFCEGSEPCEASQPADHDLVRRYRSPLLRAS